MVTNRLFSPVHLLLLDARTAVRTFLLFLVLFAGTGATRGQAGLSALAVQTRLRRPKQAASPGPTLQEREEGRKARERDGRSNFPAAPEPERLALLRINSCAAVLNSAHSWMLCHGVQR